MKKFWKLLSIFSGFTALCEKYASLGHTGAYHLTVTLNNYIGKMVSLIYSHGGDLIKFAGELNKRKNTV